MSEELKNEGVPVMPETQTDVVAMIKKMQQQLIALDKKIEILMGRPRESSFGHKPYARPSGSFSRPSFHGRSDRRPSDRGEYRHGGRSSFGSRDSFRSGETREGHFRERDSREGSSFEKKPYSSARSYHGGERSRSSDWSHGGEPRAFASKKKPFFLKCKERE